MTEDRYLTCEAPIEEIDGGFVLSDEENETVSCQHLMDESSMDKMIGRLAKEIIEDCGLERSYLLVGIKSNGIPLAGWLGKKINSLTQDSVCLGSLDIDIYRDDLSDLEGKPITLRTELPFAIENRGVILVDDVLYTGRTARAAMDALMDFGRPRFVKLAVLIDRGGRELPIHADYVGQSVEITNNKVVEVNFIETKAKNEVVIKG